MFKLLNETFDDSKGLIKICKQKNDRKCNGQKRKKKGQSTNNRPQNTAHKFNIKQHKSQGKCKLWISH